MRPPPWFDRFMAPGADRAAVLSEALAELGVRPRTLSIAGGRFVVARPRGPRRDGRYRVKVITAHHDRVAGTPGALDNSAACLQLVRFLDEARDAFNTVVVFTDKEELGQGPHDDPARRSAGPTEQGSYELGKVLAAELGPGAPMVFPLDVTGRGDALVLSRAAEGLALRQGWEPRVRAAVGSLASETAAMAEAATRLMAGRGQVLRASLPFGEDLGFMLAGLPALTVTVLPRAEAEALATDGALPAWASPSAPGSRVPATWRVLHGPDDRVGLYDDDAFRLVARFLERLAALRVPAMIA
ncbi:MAG TPA: hypothetical protein P5298_13060 [Spirochaetia bacterium]|nr:hypothetical protein [Spirochaetales bacterium]HRW25333.1 hypothetical protein [Spirochaetia bacterium]